MTSASSSGPSTAKIESFDEFYSEIERSTYVEKACLGSFPKKACLALKAIPNPTAEKAVILCIKPVKEIEKRDSVLTPKQQIERLLRPGSTYFNLNPFEVLQVDPTATLDEIKKKYRRLSILVHPDKNMDDAEKAQQAFEIVNRSYKILEEDETRKKCLDIYQEAKEHTEHMIEQKRKKMKKEGRSQDGGGGGGIPEDDPEKFKHAVYVMTMKLFADMARKRQHQDQRDMEERKRKREAEIDQEEAKNLEKEWAKNFEESRQNRVESWKTFQSGGTKEKKKKKMSGFKPPKPKPESR